jgi:hypothetical protein
MAIRFANKKRKDYLSTLAPNSAEVARNNGVVLVGHTPGSSNQAGSGIIVGRAGNTSMYGKTPKSVLATEKRNLNAFGNVKFPT